MPWDSSISEGQKSQGLTPSLAAVLDVITNEEHEEYINSGSNVGTIRFKYVEWGGHLDSADNSFSASPLDVDVQSYPLVGEIVFIQKVLDIPFYSRRININNKLQYNSFSNTLSRLNPAKSPQDKNRNVAASKENVMQHSSTVPSEHFENKNYQERESLHILKHFDGDVIIQNRYGATLRFGSSQLESALNQETMPGPVEGRSILGPTKPKNLGSNNDPIIIMRVGERDMPNTSTTSTLGLIVEDINLDSSSFVLSSNQIINFHLASTDNPVHFRSSIRLEKPFPPLGEPDTQSNLTTTPLDGNQSLLNSSRLVFNAKKDAGVRNSGNIILSSGQDFISLANRDTILDTGNDFVIGGKQIYFLDNSTDLGTVDTTQTDRYDSVALAGEVIRVITELINALSTVGAYNTPMGPAAPSPAVLALKGLLIGGPGEELSSVGKIKSYLVRIEK
jgi:hypothetical protein